jgi:GNAT superfamily N-acetyltransferase
MSDTNVVIRDARAGESVALSELMLRSKAHWGYDEAFLDACRAVLVVTDDEIRRGDVIVAELDGAVAGVASLAGTPPEVELDACFVEPGAIGTGVGRLLVDAARARARRAGARSMVVESDPNAEAFYAHLGARRIGERVSEVDPDRRLPLLRFDVSG